MDTWHIHKGRFVRCLELGKAVSKAYAALLTALVCMVLLGACAPSRPVVPSVLLQLEGPPLYVVGSMEGHIFSGRMDRSCMAGLGAFSLSNQTLGIYCEGNMDAPANEKGRLYASSDCSNGSKLELAFRNLGPDQGLGVGNLYSPDDGSAAPRLLTLVYHSCEDEAKRRLPGLLRDIEAAQQKKQSAESSKAVVAQKE